MDEYYTEKISFNDKIPDKGLELVMKDLLGNILGDLIYDSLPNIEKHHNYHRIEFESGGEKMTLSFYAPGSHVPDGHLGSTASFGEEKRAIILEDSKYRMGFVEKKEVYTQMSCNLQPARFGKNLETLMSDPNVISIEELPKKVGLHSHLVTRNVPDAKFESYRPAKNLPVDEERWESDDYRTEALNHFNELGLNGSVLAEIIVEHFDEFGIK